MTKRRTIEVTVGVLVFAVVLGLVIRNQMKVHRNWQARFALKQELHPVVPVPPAEAEYRQALFEMLRPVALSNCDMRRFGEANDGGYLMCGNLLDAVEAAYSYGIGGYDGWGCAISKDLDVTVHQYDCFDTRRPGCFFGDTVFHDACVGDKTETVDGRVFDTVVNQLASNGDGTSRILLKMDVEGAEWDSLLTIPGEALARIDQLAVELHWQEDADHRWLNDPKYLDVVRRLREHFQVANFHSNNTTCIGDLAPFPAFVFEVLFVSKRLAVVDPSRQVDAPHPLDAPNNSSLADCQPGSR